MLDDRKSAVLRAVVQSYIETTDITERVRHFSPALTDADLEELRAACGTG